MLTITPADAAQGNVPADAAGVLFRSAERLLCPGHLTAEHLHDVDELGIIVHGFHRCDACAVDELAAALESVDAERRALVYGDPTAPACEAGVARLEALELERERLLTEGR